MPKQIDVVAGWSNTRRDMSEPATAIEQLRVQYLAAQLAGDRQRALKLVVDDALASGFSVPEIHLSVIQLAQREVGRLWQTNVISVAKEHLATSISQLAIARLYEHLPRSHANGKVVVVACVEGEFHDVGGRMGADFLEMAGFDVRFLGANVPTESLLRLVEEHHAQALGLSASMTVHLPALERAVRAARSKFGQNFPVMIGGAVAEFELPFASELGVCVSADAEQLVRQCRSLLEC